MGEVTFSIDENEELLKTVWPYLVKLRAGFVCQVCSYKPKAGLQDILAHHIVPVQLGGKYTLKNGKCLCDKHHSEAHRILLPAVKTSGHTEAIGKLRKQAV